MSWVRQGKAGRSGRGLALPVKTLRSLDYSMPTSGRLARPTQNGC